MLTEAKKKSIFKIKVYVYANMQNISIKDVFQVYKNQGLN